MNGIQVAVKAEDRHFRYQDSAGIDPNRKQSWQRTPALLERDFWGPKRVSIKLD
jgi:hypothetical protein